MSPAPRADELGADEPGGGEQAAREEDRRPAPRPQPTALELVRWSLILMGISLLVAAIAIPLLRWLDLA